MKIHGINTNSNLGKRYPVRMCKQKTIITEKEKFDINKYIKSVNTLIPLQVPDMVNLEKPLEKHDIKKRIALHNFGKGSK